MDRSKLIGGVRLHNTRALAFTLKDSKDILIEFYFGESFYRQEIVKENSFWYTWIKLEIENKEKLAEIRSST